ncbi:MAG: acyloxyacyl hydrolase [Alphaproteobacteria bacterium]|nr:acyloxyacyl hydrolase [Alphaproteobacteria bacterium]
MLQRHALLAVLSAPLLLFMTSSTSVAQNVSFFDTRNSPNLLNFGAGVFNISDTDGGNKAALFQLDLVPGVSLVKFGDSFYVQPYVGAWATHEGSVMGYAGIQGLIPIGRRVEARPFMAIGVYDNGGGRELKSVALFHSGISIFYVSRPGWRFGATFTHQSHGEILSSDSENPGANNFLASVAMPWDQISN